MGSVISIIPKIHREGLRFIFLFALVTLILFLIWLPLGWMGLVLTIWCVYFFRDPERVIPLGKGLVISPADGVICFVGPAKPPEELEMGEEGWQKISVFMNVFNCHVNRSPMEGTVLKSVYWPGKFFNASFDKASDENERHSISLSNENVGVIGVVQIAGLVARRIVCDAEVGTVLNAGERFGIIRFGSRLDVYVKSELSARVGLGQTIVGGETILADMAHTGEAQETVTR